LAKNACEAHANKNDNHGDGEHFFPRDSLQVIKENCRLQDWGQICANSGPYSSLLCRPTFYHCVYRGKVLAPPGLLPPRPQNEQSCKNIGLWTGLVVSAATHKNSSNTLEIHIIADKCWKTQFLYFLHLK
jgi:hypothetical protein